MKLLLSLLCLCAASSWGAVIDSVPVRTDEVLKPVETPVRTEEMLKSVETPLRMEEMLKSDHLLKSVHMPLKTDEVLKSVETPVRTDEMLKPVDMLKSIHMPLRTDEMLKTDDMLKSVHMPLRTDEVIKSVEMPVNMVESLKKNNEMLIKPIELNNQFIEMIDDIKSPNPWKSISGEHVLFNNLLRHNYPIKPEIMAAYNLKDELEHYKKMGYPDVLPFMDDKGKIVHGIMTANAPISVQPLLSANVNKDVKFHFFNKDDEKDVFGVEVTDVNKLKELGWDESKPVKVVVHGFINSIESPAIQMIKNAYLKTGQYNVIGVDWRKLAAGEVPWYPWARHNVPAVGARVGFFLDQLLAAKLTEPSKMHIIGHSLGAHVAGIAGKSMNEGKLARITGLDPAKPLFELTGKKGHLIKDDAFLVDVIHTNAGYLGRSDLLGDVDFFPNGGTWQVGCNVDVFGSCSHGRSYELFSKTILSRNGLLGVFCEHMPSLAAGRKCLARSATNEPIKTASMGENVVFNEGGAYYVEDNFTQQHL